MLSAEKECVPKISNTSQWSSNLEAATRAIRYWNLRISKYKKQKGNDNILQQELEAGRVMDNTKTVEEATTHQADAWRHLRQILRNHKGERLKDLKEKIQSSLVEGNIQKAKEYAQLVEKEKGKDKWRAIKRALGRSLRDPLSTITIPGSSVTTASGAILTNPDVTLTTKEAVQEAIIDTNIAHFSAAEQTPIGLNTALFDAIGPHGTSAFCDAVLKAKLTEADKENIDFIEAYELLQMTARPALRKRREEDPALWLKNNIETILNTQEENENPQTTKQTQPHTTSPLSCPSLTRTEISTELTVQQFISGIKIWKETTSTSPSGRHLGHYKAIIRDAELAQLFTTLTSLPLKYGFAPERWTKTIQVVLPKDAGAPKVTRLRNINILEADYNLILRTIWGRRMIWKANDTHSLMQAQQARPGCLAISAAFNKVLSYDLFRQIQVIAISFDNDAQRCYDRIIPPHAMLCCRRLGLPKNAAQMLTNILNNTVYRIKTGQGLSAREYMSSALRRILGVGQGSCAAPAIWTAILDTILWSVVSKYSAFAVESPTGKRTERLGDAYVDDTALMANYEPSMDAPNQTNKQEQYMCTHMQDIAQDFERKLFTTGGALALNKCFWYLISWKWMEDGSATMKTLEEAPGEIYLTKGYDRENPQKIKRKEVNKSERTLGVRLNPTQDMTDEIKYRYQQIIKWAEAVNTSKLNRNDVSMAYHQVLLAMVTYPMAVTTMTAKDMTDMQVVMDRTYKTKMHLNRHFPNEVYRGSERYGGLSIAPLITHQGYKQIQLLIGSLRNGDSGGGSWLSNPLNSPSSRQVLPH